MQPNNRIVAILGASDKADRYSHKALTMLMEYGYPVLPIHPRLDTILGTSVFASLSEALVYVTNRIDTVTVYLNPGNWSPLIPEIIAIRPLRVIFNPGTEDKEGQSALMAAGIDVIEACTLVLLRSGRF